MFITETSRIGIINKYTHLTKNNFPFLIASPGMNVWLDDQKTAVHIIPASIFLKSYSMSAYADAA